MTFDDLCKIDPSLKKMEESIIHTARNEMRAGVHDPDTYFEYDVMRILRGHAGPKAWPWHPNAIKTDEALDVLIDYFTFHKQLVTPQSHPDICFFTGKSIWDAQYHLNQFIEKYVLRIVDVKVQMSDGLVILAYIPFPS